MATKTTASARNIILKCRGHGFQYTVSTGNTGDVNRDNTVVFTLLDDAIAHTAWLAYDLDHTVTVVSDRPSEAQNIVRYAKKLKIDRPRTAKPSKMKWRTKTTKA